MKKLFKFEIGRIGMLACLFLLSFSGISQVAGTHFTVGMTTSSPTTNTVDIVVTLTVDPAANSAAATAGGNRVAQIQLGINFNKAILNGGTPSLVYVDGRSSALSSLVFNTPAALSSHPITTLSATTGHLRIPSTAISFSLPAPDLSATTTYVIGRYRFSTSTSWTANSNAQLWFNPTNGNASTNSAVLAAAYGTTTPTFTYSSTAPSASPGVGFGTISQSAPLSVPLNACSNTSSSQDVTACDSYTWTAGNGTTYTQSGTYTSVTNIPGGSCTDTKTLNLTITPSSVHTTTASACDSYTWNGTTYTASGLYTGTTSNCVTEKLDLTITPSSVHTTTASACDSYTWNGTTYTASGLYTGTTSNCVTEKLSLTITPSTTNTTTLTVNTSSYTWSVNGQTYSTSGTYSSVSGCHTEVLVLTISPCTNTTSSETQVACDIYRWHGVTYTASGDYTYTSTNGLGCTNVATLHLTINHSTTTSETKTACTSYTWNGTTYTASGDYTYTSTNVSGCDNVATLHLTINNNTTSEETQTVCDSYTWNGTTYTASGDYTYSSTNGSGCTNVATLHLTINSNAITYQSSDPVICKLANATATASVTALGSTYQWYSQGATVNSGWTPLANNVNYSGVTSNTLTIKRTTLTLPVTGTKYQVVVSGSGGCAQATSTPFTLKESLASKGAAITAKSAANTALLPTNTTCVGSALSLTLAAGSVGNIQWMYSSNGSPWTQFATSAANVTNAATQVNSAFTVTTPALAAGSTSFKVIATNGGCSSLDDTAHILNITVSPQPVAGTISGGNVTVCTPLATGINTTGTALTAPITNSTVLTLGGSSNVGTIVWQKSINYVNTTSTTPTWTAVANLTATTAIGASYLGAGTSALTVGNLAVTTWYRAIVTNGACSDISTPVKITVTPPAKAGVLTSTVLNSSSNSVVSATVCYGGDITFTSATYTGSSIQWQVSTTSTTTGFSDISGANSSSYTMTGVTYAPLSNFYVRSMITSGSCTAAYSAVKTITVNPTSVGGTVTGGGVVCSAGVAGTLKVTGYTGTIQWQYSTDNSTWFNAPFNATSGYQNPTGATTFATTSATATAAASYIVTTVTAHTYFRALVTSGVCSSATSNVVEYVLGTAQATSISADNAIVCPSTGTTLRLASGSVGTITWQKLVSPSTTWTNVTTSTSSVASTGNLTATTQFRAVLTVGSCTTDTTAPITVTVDKVATSKGITASVSSPVGGSTTQICTNSTIVKTLSVTPGYIGTIQWQSATTNTTSTVWTNILGANGETYTINNSTANIGANNYRVVFTYSCGAPAISNTLTVYYKSCSLKAPEKEVVADFGVIASPSPFTENFNLNLTTSSEDKVQVMVYDMIGKLIDQKEVSPSEATTLQVGDRYPSGVYNVIVTQGENTKTLRVIKR